MNKELISTKELLIMIFSISIVISVLLFTFFKMGELKLQNELEIKKLEKEIRLRELDIISCYAEMEVEL